MPCGPPIERNGLRTITSAKVIELKEKFGKYLRTTNYRHHESRKKNHVKKAIIFQKKKCFDEIIDEFICINCSIWFKQEKNHHGRFGSSVFGAERVRESKIQ